MSADPLPILEMLNGVKSIGDKQWLARCPAHQDDVASLSIGIGRDGQILFHCHAGCSLHDIMGALDLEFSDLYPSEDPVKHKRTVVARYNYTNEAGKMLYQVVRYKPKNFAHRAPLESGGWTWNTKGVIRVPYNLPEVSNAEEGSWIFITEGEKDADSLKQCDLIATTNSGGAGSWYTIPDLSPFKNKKIVIMPDADVPGKEHAEDVALRLKAVAESVKILDLSKVEGFEGKDVSDWCAWIYKNKKNVKKELYELIKQTKGEWEDG